MSRACKSRGFTLLEVMVATVLMSIVAIVTYAAAQVSVSARTRMGRALHAAQRARATRQLLEDVLRNVQASPRPEDSTFVVQRDHLSFVAAGPGPPFDADYSWRITISADSGGCDVRATPMTRAPAAEMRFRLAGVTRWDARVLAPDGQHWTSEWPADGTLPRAISLQLWSDLDSLGPPLHVALASGTPFPAADPFAGRSSASTSTDVP